MILLFFLLILALIDYLTGYYLPFLPVVFSYFQPQLFLTTLLSFFILKNKNKKLIKYLFLSIFVYDLLFGKIYFLKLVFFFFLYQILLFFQKKIHFCLVTYLIFMIFSFLFYYVCQYIILLEIGTIGYSFIFFLQTISHFLIIHVIYSIILYYFLGIKGEKV